MGSNINDRQKDSFNEFNEVLINIQAQIGSLIINNSKISNASTRNDLAWRASRVAKAAEALMTIYEVLPGPERD